MMREKASYTDEKETKTVQKTPETALGILDLPVLNLEEDNSFNVVGETNNGTKQKNILPIVKNDYLIVGQIINHLNPSLYVLDDRFINIDTVGGLVLTIDRYPMLYLLLQGSVLLDSSYVDEAGLTFKVKDMTSYPYLRNGGAGTQDHTLPNVKGQVINLVHATQILEVSGAGSGLYVATNSGGGLVVSTATDLNDAGYNKDNITLDLSRANSIYKNSAGVEVKAIKTYRYIIGDSKS